MSSPVSNKTFNWQQNDELLLRLGWLRAAPTQQDFKVGGICLKGIASSPFWDLWGRSLSFTYQAGLGTGLLSSVLSILETTASCLQDQTQEGTQDWGPLNTLSTLRVPGLDHNWFSCACPLSLLPSNNKLGIIFPKY